MTGPYARRLHFLMPQGNGNTSAARVLRTDTATLSLLKTPPTLRFITFCLTLSFLLQGDYGRSSL